MGSHHDRWGSADAGCTGTARLYAIWRLSSDPGIGIGLLPRDGQQRGYRCRQGVLQSCEAWQCIFVLFCAKLSVVLSNFYLFIFCCFLLISTHWFKKKKDIQDGYREFLLSFSKLQKLCLQPDYRWLSVRYWFLLLRCCLLTVENTASNWIEYHLM